MSTTPYPDVESALNFDKPLKKMAYAVRPADPAGYCGVAAALIKTAYQLQGEPDHFMVRLFEQVNRQPDNDGSIKLAGIVYQALGKIAWQQQELEKLATGGLATAWAGLQNLWGGTKTVPPSALKLLAFLGTAAGATAGAGAWSLNRSLTKDDQSLRELEIQRDTYRKLTTEVEDELRRRKLAPTPANTAAAVDYLT